MSTEHINELLALVAKRRNFLDKHPHLQELQDRIDATLDAVGSDPIERCRTIQHIMAQSAFNLAHKMKELIVEVDLADLPGQIELLKKLKEIENDTKSR